MPTVAYIASSSIPSSSANSIQVVRMCAALQRSGYDVTLYAPAQNLASRGQDIFAYYGLSERFRVRLLTLPRIRGGSHVFAASAARIARDTADVTYTRTIEGAFYSTLFGVATIFEAHAPIEAFRPTQRWMLSRVARSRHLRKIVVISHYLRERYMRARPTCPVVVAADAADLPAQSQPGLSASNAQPLRVGYAGSLYRGRGTELLLELAESCPWAVFEVYGGPAAAVSEMRARAARYTNLTFHGSVDPADVHSRLGSCDVLVAPYERSVFTGTDRMDTSRWMSPMKIFEYMAARRPIVCSDLPAIREILDDGVSALLCTPGDRGEWVDALCTLRDTPELRRRLADSAYARLERDYTWNARVERVMEGVGQA